MELLSTFKKIALEDDLSSFMDDPIDLLLSLSTPPKGWQDEALCGIIEDTIKGDGDCDNRYVIYASYGVGKTTFLCMLILAHLYEFGYCTNKPYSGNIVSGSLQQLQTVIHKTLKKTLNGSGYEKYFTLTKSDIYVNRDPTKSIRFLVCNENNVDTFAGVHEANGYVLNIFDEGTAICDEAYDIAQTFMDKGNCTWVVAGNPTTTAGKFYQITRSKEWNVININRKQFWGDDDRWSESIKTQYGEDSDVYRVKVLGQFPESVVNLVFDNYAINESIERGKHIDAALLNRKGKPTIIGVDVATGGGECDHAIVVRNEDCVLELHIAKVGLPELPQRIVHVAEHYNVRTIFIDSIGCGAGIHSYVKALLYRGGRNKGIMVRTFTASNSPVMNFNCMDRISETAMFAREWCNTKGGFLPSENIKRFIDELRQVQFYPDRAKIKLVKKTGPRDLADAFIMTFASPYIIDLDPVYNEI